MATTVVESMLVITSQTPTFSFQSTEQWHRSLPAKQQLQLTSRNLRTLGATLKTLNVPGQTPRPSPSPSESSSDSESNHRIHRSTKKVCVREDMNTTREISPRPSRPTTIVVSEPFATSGTKWSQPDTPAPWHTSTLKNAQDEAGDKSPFQTPIQRSKSTDLVVQLNKMVISSQNSSTSATRNRSASNGEVIQQIGTTTRRRRLPRSSCGNGIGICRRSHFALPRPQSLAKPRSLSFTSGIRPSSLVPASAVPSGSGECDDWVADHPGSSSTYGYSCPSSNGMPLSYEADGPDDSMVDILATGTTIHPITLRQQSAIAHIVLADRPRQLMTYVDQVRAQRLPPNVAHSRISPRESKGEFKTLRQRRMSV